MRLGFLAYRRQKKNTALSATCKFEICDLLHGRFERPWGNAPASVPGLA